MGFDDIDGTVKIVCRAEIVALFKGNDGLLMKSESRFGSQGCCKGVVTNGGSPVRLLVESLGGAVAEQITEINEGLVTGQSDGSLKLRRHRLSRRHQHSYEESASVYATCDGRRTSTV